jgi:hypothetical protein
MANAPNASTKDSDPTRVRLRSVWFGLDLAFKSCIESPPEIEGWTPQQVAAWRAMWEALAVVVMRMEAFRKLIGY